MQHQRLDRVFGALNGFQCSLGLVVAAFQFNTCRDDVGGCQRSGFHQSLIVIKLRLGQANRFGFDFAVAASKNQIPIRALHLRNDLDGALAELAVRNI